MRLFVRLLFGIVIYKICVSLHKMTENMVNVSESQRESFSVLVDVVFSFRVKVAYIISKIVILYKLDLPFEVYIEKEREL